MTVKARKIELTQDRLKELLDYDPMTGVFVWKVKPARRYHAGSVAGSAHHKTGYVRLCVDGREYLAHRLAWIFMTGEQPPEYIDHIDGSRAHNAWDNLRASDASHNLQNLKRATTRSKSKLLGVKQGSRNSFRAIINIGGKFTTIGSFPTAEAAAAAYIATKRRVHAGCTL